MAGIVPARRASVGGLVAAITGVALILTGCTTITAESQIATDLTAEQQEILQSGYDGEALQEPTADGPPAERGKQVWAVSCGEAYQACSLMSAAFAEAGEQLGWDVNLVDGKADPSVATGLIRQAVAAGVDGIAVFSYDCPGVKSGLEAARAADVPVVQFTSIDCNDDAFGSGESLYTAGLNVMGSTEIKDYYLKWGAARADYVAALMGGEGKLLEIANTDQRTQQYANQGFEEQFEKACPGCELVKVPFTFAQVPREATAKWNSALMQNPDAKAVATGIDSLMGLGLQSALKQANFGGIVAGGEGLNLDLVRDGIQDTETVIPYALASWGLANTLNRIFAGENPTALPSEGGGWQFIDNDHNLPAAGQPWEPPFDFRALYASMWNN